LLSSCELLSHFCLVLTVYYPVSSDYIINQFALVVSRVVVTDSLLSKIASVLPILALVDFTDTAKFSHRAYAASDPRLSFKEN